MLIKRSPSGTPESISSSLVQFSEESLYYSLTCEKKLASVSQYFGVRRFPRGLRHTLILRYFCLLFLDLERFCRCAFLLRVLITNKSPFVSFNTTKFTKTTLCMYP